MSKINVECVLESSEGKHVYKGKALFKDGIITYDDHGVMTKIVLGDVIAVERRKDYKMTLFFKQGQTIESDYITEHGTLCMSVKTLELVKEDNSFKIKYVLILDDKSASTFLLNFKYSIDSDINYV